eukprot:10763973-Alexandrium_andersonii.AAC.1
MPPEAPVTAPAAAAEEPARKRPRLPQPAAAPARAPAVLVPTQATLPQPTKAFNAFRTSEPPGPRQGGGQTAESAHVSVITSLIF